MSGRKRKSTFTSGYKSKRRKIMRYRNKRKRLLRFKPEYKFVQTNWNVVELTNGVQYNYDLNNIAQGTDYNQRIGHNVRTTGINGWIRFTCGGYSHIRIYLVIPHDTDDDVTASTYASPDHDKFTVLKEWQITCDPTVESRYTRRIFIKKRFKGLGLRTNFDDETATTCTRGRVILTIYPTAISEAMQTVMCVGNIKTWYTDL